MTLLDSCKTILSSEIVTNSDQRLAEIGSVKSFKGLAQLYFRDYGDMDGFIQLLDKASSMDYLKFNTTPSWAEGKKLDITEFRFPYWEGDNGY